MNGALALQLAILLVVWGVPIALLIWLIRTLSTMATSLRSFGDRLAAVERALQDAALSAPRAAPPNER